MEDTKLIKDLINQLVVNTKKLDRATRANNKHYMFVYTEMIKVISTQLYREANRLNNF